MRAPAAAAPAVRPWRGRPDVAFGISATAAPAATMQQAAREAGRERAATASVSESALAVTTPAIAASSRCQATSWRASVSVVSTSSPRRARAATYSASSARRPARDRQATTSATSHRQCDDEPLPAGRSAARQQQGGDGHEGRGPRAAPAPAAARRPARRRRRRGGEQVAATPGPSRPGRAARGRRTPRRAARPAAEGARARAAARRTRSTGRARPNVRTPTIATIRSAPAAGSRRG